VVRASQSTEALRFRVVSLEAELDRERRERTEEAELFSKMLIKVTEAETEARTLRERVVELENALGGKGPRERVLASHLNELREVMTRVADVFDDLERREQAIAEFRSRGLRDARGALRRAAGAEKAPPAAGGTPSIPVDADVEDVSEMVEIVASLRPAKT
jgi:chromosome segregation ATPase